MLFRLRTFSEQQLHSPAGLLDESDGDQDPVAQEDEREEDDGFGHRYDDH